MDCPDLRPPAAVRGMTVLEREAFNKQAKVPYLKVPGELNFNTVCMAVKKLLLKMERYKPVRTEEAKIILHPAGVKSWDDLKELKLDGLDSDCLGWEEIQIGFDNWRYDEIFRAVLPEDKEGLSAFSKVGHVIHLNLKDHLLPYKALIGEVIKDKIATCRTVVNKLDTIDNTYRNFAMELLAGEEDYQVSVKENGTVYEFDFSKVYWNPRLSTEHEKVAKMLRKEDILLDIYAGVGPFSIPVAKKGCSVLANDLNPESYKALVHNCKKNKVEGRVKCFNRNGIDFIREEVKTFIVEINKKDDFKGTINITMNLPALAVEHLEHFVGLLSDETVTIVHFPLVHVYCFAKGVEDKKDIARQMTRLRKMAKRSTKNRQQVKQVAKKAKNVFAVTQGKKNNTKKAKEVSTKLKKINVNAKREKADKNFQDLHAQIVSKKQNNKPTPKPLPAKNKSQPNTKQMEADLDKMQM
ncbi:tRNA methyltransferase [Culex quinquefasciatus]|uniref:tRNA (guanine(37)-N1)-methyltransferase n=1 Tax=Culex quinquefasciatus TaxID=7176 RepID=B0WR25_CULQU|nr:tRNA methyltransferase [Culex quinquefasciatus]|eukprot:XP_001851159.1 tRNA methyltransferase [Culex quinquefasciatus]